MVLPQDQGGAGVSVAQLIFMKTLFRRIFKKHRIVEGELPLFRFYMNDFNAPTRARYPDNVHI